MRPVILIIAALLSLFAVAAQWMFYEELYGEQLVLRTRDALSSMGIKDLRVSLHYFDVTMEGNVSDEKLRQQAAAALMEIHGLRLASQGNQLRIPQRLAITRSTDVNRVTVSGWLVKEESAELLRTTLRDLRPDLTFDFEKLHVSPHVQVSPETPEPLTADHPLVKRLITDWCLPSSIDISRGPDGFDVKGTIPDHHLRQQILTALQGATPNSVVRTQMFVANPHVPPASFTADSDIATFLAALFKSPSIAEFRISSESGVLIRGAATREQESTWLAMLRSVAGGLPVKLQLELYPSPIHLPGYQPKSEVEPAQLNELLNRLKKIVIRFEPGSVMLPNDTASELASVTPALVAAGPGLQLIVGAHVSPSDGQGYGPGVFDARLHRVIQLLVTLGLPRARIYPMFFRPSDNENLDLNAWHPDLVDTVELLIQ